MRLIVSLGKWFGSALALGICSWNQMSGWRIIGCKCDEVGSGLFCAGLYGSKASKWLWWNRTSRPTHNHAYVEKSRFQQNSKGCHLQSSALVVLKHFEVPTFNTIKQIPLPPPPPILRYLIWYSQLTRNVLRKFWQVSPRDMNFK